jgi:hypothetical protein
VQEEDHQCGRQGVEEVPHVLERGRRHRPDDQVPEDPAAERGDLGEHGDTEDVEVLPDREQAAGQGEDEDPDQVECLLHAGLKQLRGHPVVLSDTPGNRRTTTKGREALLH